MDEINLYTAIAEMRKLTAQQIPFSFEHYTWDRDRRKASGLRTVSKALLRPAAKGDKLADADHKLFYEDLNVSDPAQANRNCWQILIVSFNGTRVTPKQVFYENI
jgi:hypothetical protein